MTAEGARTTGTVTLYMGAGAGEKLRVFVWSCRNLLLLPALELSSSCCFFTAADAIAAPNTCIEPTCSCFCCSIHAPANLSQKPSFSATASGTHTPAWHIVAATLVPHGTKFLVCNWRVNGAESGWQLLLLLQGLQPSVRTPVTGNSRVLVPLCRCVAA